MSFLSMTPRSIPTRSNSINRIPARRLLDVVFEYGRSAVHWGGAHRRALPAAVHPCGFDGQHPAVSPHHTPYAPSHGSHGSSGDGETSPASGRSSRQSAAS